MGHAFLLIAVISFGMLGILHKVADHQGCRPEGINMVLFGGAAACMFGATLWQNGWSNTLDLPFAGWMVAVVCGVLSSLAILSFQHGVRFGRISTSWLVINLSTTLPTLLSILLYHETVRPRRAAGLVLAVVALVILWAERVREEKAAMQKAAQIEQNIGTL